MSSRFIWSYSDNFIDPDYVDESIQPPKNEPKKKLPAPLRAARSLEKKAYRSYMNRRSLFYNEAKLLEFYKDDYDGGYITHCYYPTYDLLSDEELRSYFAWRTKVRQGNIELSCTSFAYLYLYELINQIGTGTPVEGLHKFDDFVAAYRQYDTLLDYDYADWRKSYIVYYNLSDSFLSEKDRGEKKEAHMEVLDSAQEQTDEALVEAVKALAPSWLGRSKFYKTNQADMDKVIARVLRRMNKHYATRSKRTFSEQLFGSRGAYRFKMFESAVFCDPLKHEDSRYYITDSHYIECKCGYWEEIVCRVDGRNQRKLENLMKGIDASLRVALNEKPIKAPGELKWVSKIIQEETAALLEEKKKAAEAKRAEQAAKAARQVKIDYSVLDRIRKDAAITQEKLAIEDEMEEEAPPVPQPEPEVQPEAQSDGCPLDKTEYRLMQCLLYGGDTGWVQQEGKMVSVLLDSINEKLYDIFQDAVIEDDRVVEDYIDDLKEMVKP